MFATRQPPREGAATLESLHGGIVVTFVAPAGWTLAAALGAGGSFRVARVRNAAGVVAIARRPRAHESAVASLTRHDAVLSALQGQSVVPRRLDAGEDDYGPFAIESEAPGIPLASLVARSGALPNDLALALARAAFEALATLHAAADARGPLGFVHADLGPDHLFVAPTPDAGVTLIDFGLACVRGLSPLSPDVRGTMPYVAPERARGEGTPAPSADVYALGATFLFALSGRPPGASHPAALVALGERGLDLPPVPAGPLRRALTAALRFDAVHRPSPSEIVGLLT